MLSLKTIFSYQDYKDYVNSYVESLPNNGRGQYRRISNFLGVNSVVISQVFKGSRELTTEQAFELSKYLGHTNMEREYLILLIHYARAGTKSLKDFYLEQINEIQKKSKLLKNRIPQDSHLNSEEKAIFYSHWYYSAIRLASSFKNLNSVEQMADFLHLERSLVAEILEFLVSKNLVKKDNKGYHIGAKVTHIENNSPFVIRHHMNWRVKALQSLDDKNENNLHYTGPMALSKKAADQIREKLIEVIKESTKLASESDSEDLFCLTIDWFGV